MRSRGTPPSTADGATGLRWLFWSAVTWSAGFGLFAYTWPLAALRLHAGPLVLGGMVGGSSLAGALVSLPGGRWADRCERRRIIIASWVACIPAPLLFALATSWPLMAVGWLLFGLSMFGNPALQAYVLDLAPSHRPGASYAATMAGFAWGNIPGPLVGGVMAQRWGLAATFWAALLMFVLSTLLLLPLRPDPPRERPGPSGAAAGRLPLGTLALVLAAATLTMLAGPFVSPFLHDQGGWSLATIGVFGSLTSAASALAAPLLGRVMDRWRRGGGVAVGALAVALGSAALAARPRSGAGLVAGGLGRGTGFALANLGGMLAGSAVSPAQRGRVLGVYNLGTQLAGVALPVAGGWLFAWRPASVFWATALLALTVGVAAGRASLDGAEAVRPQPPAPTAGGPPPADKARPQCQRSASGTGP